MEHVYENAKDDLKVCMICGQITPDPVNQPPPLPCEMPERGTPEYAQRLRAFAKVQTVESFAEALCSVLDELPERLRADKPLT